jgi:hypothetical protein
MTDDTLFDLKVNDKRLCLEKIFFPNIFKQKTRSQIVREQAISAEDTLFERVQGT